MSHAVASGFVSPLVIINICMEVMLLLEKVIIYRILRHQPQPVYIPKTPERVRWGQTSFRVNDDPEIGQLGQLDEEYYPKLGHSDSITCQVCRKLTKFWVTSDPELI